MSAIDAINRGLNVVKTLHEKSHNSINKKIYEGITNASDLPREEESLAIKYLVRLLDARDKIQESCITSYFFPKTSRKRQIDHIIDSIIHEFSQNSAFYDLIYTSRINAEHQYDRFSERADDQWQHEEDTEDKKGDKKITKNLQKCERDIQILGKLLKKVNEFSLSAKAKAVAEARVANKNTLKKPHKSSFIFFQSCFGGRKKTDAQSTPLPESRR